MHLKRKKKLCTHLRVIDRKCVNYHTTQRIFWKTKDNITATLMLPVITSSVEYNDFRPNLI